MRRFIIFSLLLISVLVVCRGASVQSDSVKVFFALNKATVDPSYNNDAASMKQFIDGLAIAAKAGNIDSIVVRGYASPDGPFPTNDRLSIERCNAVANYISREAGISRADIRTSPGGVAWDGLKAMVINHEATPCRDQVIRILDQYIPGACINRTLSDECLKSLMAVDNGRAYKWLLDNLFPELRYALAIYVYRKDGISTNEMQLAYENIELAPTLNTVSKLSECKTIITNQAFSCPPRYRLAIKTNLPYYALLLPNLEAEWLVNDQWSVALEGDVAWWGKYSNEQSYRLAIVSPEVKRWFRTRAPWHGFYVGLFAGGGLYDLENKKKGYRGEGGMAGLSVGYMWPISRNLSFEAAIGAGYMYTKYKEYKPLDGHHVYQRTKALNYIGPLKVKFSLVWRLWDVNKSCRKNVANQIMEQYEK